MAQVDDQALALPNEFISAVQLAAVQSPAQHRLVSGVAGACKTDTLVKAVVHEWHKPGGCRKILCLSKYGSVTHELIARFQAKLGIVMPSAGGNHFVHDDGVHILEVANLDAAVHLMLSQVLPYEEMQVIGERHQEKMVRAAEMALERRITAFNIKTRGNPAADMIVVDEFEDMDPNFVDLVTRVLENNSECRSIVAGDMFQTLCDKALERDEMPMRVYEQRLAAQTFPLAKCMRCPKSHIQFVNTVMKPLRSKLGMEITHEIQIARADEQPDQRPILFTHEKVSSNAEATETADWVTALIMRWREDDPSLRLGGIAVLMRTVNENQVFACLHASLERKLGAGSAEIVITKGPEGRQTVEWNRLAALDAVKMMSIHAARGKTFDAVIVLGVTEASIPMKHRLFRPAELIDWSILNVAITRSRGKLAVGMTRGFPSRYIRDVREQLKEVATLTWTQHGCTRFCSGPPWFDNPNYLQEQVSRPPRLMLSASISVPEFFEDPSSMLPGLSKSAADQITFGTRCDWPEYLTKNRMLAPVLNMLGQVVVRSVLLPANNPTNSRHYTTERYLLEAIEANDVMWTDEPLHLDIAKDAAYLLLSASLDPRDPKSFKFMILRMMNDAVVEGRSGEWTRACREIHNGDYSAVLPRAFRCTEMRDSCATLLNPQSPLEDIPCSVFWNVSLAHLYMLSAQFRPVNLPAHVGQFEGGQQGTVRLIENARALRQAMPGMFDIQQTQVPCVLASEEGRGEVMKAMGEATPFPFGIVGIANALSAGDAGNTIVQIQVSSATTLKNDWLIQGGVYCAIGGIPRLCVVNIGQGTAWVCNDLGTADLEIGVQVVRRILAKAHFRSDHVETLVERLRSDPDWLQTGANVAAAPLDPPAPPQLEEQGV